VKVAEDHAKKAAADASRLAEELRQEQDHSSQIEKARRTAETVAKDLQTRLDEAEAAAMQGGRKIVQKMEQVREGVSQQEVFNCRSLSNVCVKFKNNSKTRNVGQCPT